MKTQKLLMALALVVPLTTPLTAQITERGTTRIEGKAPAEKEPCGWLNNRPLTPQECEEFTKNWHKMNIERFIPKNFTRDYNVSDIKLLDSLEPLIAKLEGLIPSSDTSTDWDYTPKPTRSYKSAITVTLRTDEESRVISNIWLRLWSYDSLKRAEEGLAENAGMIPVALDSGSFTGREVGELTYHRAKENESAFIIFLRRNVVVSINYSAPLTVPRNSKKGPGPSLDDPELVNKCEALAKKIDDLVLRLTRK